MKVPATYNFLNYVYLNRNLVYANNYLIKKQQILLTLFLICCAIKANTRLSSYAHPRQTAFIISNLFFSTRREESVIGHIAQKLEDLTTEGYIKESPWRKTKQEINEPPAFIYSGVDGLSVYVVSSTYVWPLHPYWQSSTASVTQLRHQEMDSSSSGYDFLTAVWPGDKGTGPVYTWCSVLLIWYCVLMTMTYQTCLRSP